jgi:death-on-curing protein
VSETRLLTVEDVLLIHRDGIEEYGGSLGVRDIGLIESAVASAQNLTVYGSPDHAEIAAIYLFSLCKNHGFVDGNKRVALRAADVFLKINGLDLILDNDAAYDLTWRTATSEIGRDEIAALIREQVVPL